MRAAAPANQFLAAAPCGPDGQPLTPLERRGVTAGGTGVAH